MRDNIFEKLTAEEQTQLWMYMIFNRDAILEKMEEWTKEAEKRDMTLTEYLESINPLDGIDYMGEWLNSQYTEPQAERKDKE